MKRLFLATAVLAAITFSCKKKDHTPPATAPVVTTAAVTNITINSATGGGSIVSDGGAAVIKSGIVWSLNNNTPTFKDSVVAGTTANGTFTSNITGLDFNRTYYVRAFAINSVDTAYGSAVSFTTNADTNKVRFTYNGQEVVYGVIVSPTTGKKWLDRNLGAKQVATAYNDYQAYGDLFQWGRPADGHQLINWTSSTTGTPVNGITATLATSDIPGHNNYIDASSNVDPSTGNNILDWRSDNNRNRWNTNHQGPCPDGWHVPTFDEWAAEVSKTQNGGTATAGGIVEPITAYNLLKLTVAGWRGFTSLSTSGSSGPGHGANYWSSTDEIINDPISAGSRLRMFEGAAEMNSQLKGVGSAVRCIKN